MCDKWIKYVIVDINSYPSTFMWVIVYNQLNTQKCKKSNFYEFSFNLSMLWPDMKKFYFCFLHVFILSYGGSTNYTKLQQIVLLVLYLVATEKRNSKFFISVECPKKDEIVSWITNNRIQPAKKTSQEKHFWSCQLLVAVKLLRLMSNLEHLQQLMLWRILHIENSCFTTIF